MPDKWAQYAQQPGQGDKWAQYAAPTAETAPTEPEGNAVQRAFDKFTTVTPEQEKGHSYPVNALQHLGAGLPRILTPLFHPEQALEKASESLANPSDTLGQTIQGVKADPWGTAGTMLGGALVGGAMGEAAPRVMAKIPSTTRAANTLSNIETKAANTPVGFQNTEPALQKFAQHVATGGKGADVMEKLNSRINAEPMNFPEARDFYTNVSDVTRKPGFLRRALEDPKEPRLRYAAGPVREGMNADLTESLKPLNLDADYNAALKEYAQGKALKSGLKKAGIAAAGMGAGALGLGKIHGIASSVLR